jgi:type IV secretory pathway TraG/TraD family ATPase VirD4
VAAQWGRKETVIWPPQMPIFSYGAIVLTVFCVIAFALAQLRFFETPFRKSYLTSYIRARIGAQFHQFGRYRLLYLIGGRRNPRLALPVDFVRGQTRKPDGRIVPVTLSSLALSQGYTDFMLESERNYNDARLYRWFRDAVYARQSPVQIFTLTFVGGFFVLILSLVYAVPKDIRRFKQLKYGRLLRGPVMRTPKEFNATCRGKGMGFKTDELKALMRVPDRKEAQHFLFMGDTGAGKTQLIMQLMRQIQERDDAAIVYDPAGEFLQRFYHEKRGDIVLNPLDDRGPYWGPAEEMETPAEANAIATSLYQPNTDRPDEFFHKTPAKIFAHLLQSKPTPHELAAWMADARELEKRVAGTVMEHFINQSGGAQRVGVLSSLGLVADCLQLLPTRDQARGRTWTTREWAKERKGWVFITSQPIERETLRPLHSLWIDLLVLRLLSKPQPGQKRVWFVIDELASLQRLPQLHTAITENRKSNNPLVLGFQGKAQLEVTYGHLAEVMLSSPASKIFMKTGEPKAAEWIENSIGKVEIERLRETKFDGTRRGHNFTVDRQIEPLVMASEISGLDDRHAYLKLGNNVARFAFDYLEMPVQTKDFIPRRDSVPAGVSPEPTPVPSLPKDGEKPPARSSNRNRPAQSQGSTTQQTTLALVSVPEEDPCTEVRSVESGNGKKEW